MFKRIHNSLVRGGKFVVVFFGGGVLYLMGASMKVLVM